jgi:NADP-dependent 3-hydroxy acid dehydrogenase YdfG
MPRITQGAGVIAAGKQDEAELEGRASPLESLAGRMAVVTGASSGIGRAIAEELAARGASLCLLGRRPEVLQGIAQGNADGARKLIYQIDLGLAREIEALPASLRHDGGAADILIHSAGVISLGDFDEGRTEDFDRQINVNLKAPYLLTQALLAQLKSRRGHVVFINSSAGICAVPGSGPYSASKHGLKGLADSLRAEVNGKVRVTSVFAGNTATPMQASLHAARGRAYDPETLIQPRDVALVVCHALSLPQTVELTDVHIRPAQPPSHGSPSRLGRR